MTTEHLAPPTIGNGPDEPVVLRLAPGELLADAAYKNLRQAILNRGLEPGDQLSVPELARRMDISRSPVREAVQRLISDGLATAVPRRGAVVTEMRARELDDLFEVRALLEGLAARRAATRADAVGLETLRLLLDEHEKLISAGDIAAQVELDMQYHRAVRGLADNGELNTTLDRIEVRSHLALNTLWRRPASSRQSLLEHHAIYDALAAGDADAAESAARAHVGSVRRRVAEYLASLDVEKP
jgi:DNA-binding GntR family transcriptional regulator